MSSGMKSVKIFYQTVCLMVLFILKNYLKPRQKKIQGISEVLKSKIIWKETISFRVVKERKCERSLSLG